MMSSAFVVLFTLIVIGLDQSVSQQGEELGVAGNRIINVEADNHLLLLII